MSLTVRPFTLFRSRLYPDVVFTLRSITRGVRILIDKELAPLRQEQQDLSRESFSVDKELEPFRDVARKSPCTCDHPDDMHDVQHRFCTVEGCNCRHPQFPVELELQFQQISRRLVALDYNLYEPALILAVVASVTGIDVVDSLGPVPVSDIVNIAPEDLTQELVTEIKRLLGLSPAEIKNSQRPTILPAMADGTGPNSIVEPVSSETSTEPATAASIFSIR